MTSDQWQLANDIEQMTINDLNFDFNVWVFYKDQC